MATWLAVDQAEFNGATAVASGWLARAERLLEPLEPGPDHGWLAFHQGYFAHAEGDSARARELAATAVELGRRFEVEDLEMLGLALDGAALVSSGHVDEGMRCLDEATSVALENEASIPIANAWTFCILVTSCTTVHDYVRAVEWTNQIAEFAERYGSRYMLAFCRAHYGAVQLWRGRWADAEAELTSAVDDFGRSRPAWAAAPLLELAELQRRQGRASEAAQLLDEAGLVGEAGLCRARLALDRGDALRAVDLMERLLRQLPDTCRIERAPGLELLVHARVARGDSKRQAPRSRSCARPGSSSAQRPSERQPTVPRGPWRQHAVTMTARDNCSRTPSTATSGAALRSRRLQRGSSSPRTHRARSVESAHREASAALDRFAELGAEKEAQRARRMLSTDLPLRSASSRHASARFSPSSPRGSRTEPSRSASS